MHPRPWLKAFSTDYKTRLQEILREGRGMSDRRVRNALALPLCRSCFSLLPSP
jgi:hypothetical protein